MSANMYSESPTNMHVMATSRNQYDGTGAPGRGLKAIRKVTTTRKIDMAG